MKLPVPALFAKKEKTEYFLALLLREEKASAVILEELEGKIHIIGKHEEYFSVSVEDVSLEEMLEVLDKTISKAEQTLPPNIETEKTVFGVKENWVEDKKIKKEYLLKLKKVSDELHLKPIGFLVISEAIAHLIQEEEGAPFTGLIAEVGKKSVTLTLFRAGKSIETHADTIEDTVPGTVDGLLKRFTSSDILPSRVIIFNGLGNDALGQEFITHQWSRSLPFLHVPQVAVLPGNFDARAVVFGAAEQMGFEIIGSIVDKTAHEIKPLPTNPEEKEAFAAASRRKSEEPTAKDADNPDNEEDKGSAEEKPDGDKPFPTSGDNFGFVMGKDVAESIKKEEDTLEDTEHSGHPEKAIENVHEELPTRRHTPDRNESAKHELSERKVEHEVEQDDNGNANGSPLSRVTGILAGMTAGLPGIFSSLPRLPGVGGGNKLLLIPPAILLIVVVLIILYIFQTKATVMLTLQPKMIDETESVTFSTEGGNNFDDNVIQAENVSTTLSGSTTGEVSGKKEIGEKAKGSVTLFNSDDSKKTLAAGTIIKSNDLEFTLDKETVVASASGDIFSGIKSGTTKADVTAAKIGTESNLPSNGKFSVAGSSSLAAKNDSAFSGGTKKNVTVVSKKDLEKLAAELPESLKNKAKEDLEKKISDDGILLPEFTSVTLTKKTYSKKEGEEAKELKLTADVAFDAVSYKKSDLDGFAQALLKDRATSDQAIAKNTIEADAKDIKEEEDGTVKASLSIKAGLLPKLDQSQIIENIYGKSFDEANSYLKNMPQVESADIEFSPNIPFLPKLLPRSKSNISIVIKDQ
jgi:hypothetical protein